MARHPDHPLARALAGPGHELQHRLATAEPSPEQLEVAEAALAACLELEEHGDDRDSCAATRLPPEIFDLPVEKMREGYYTDAYFNHTRAALLADGRHPRVVMQVFQSSTRVLGGMDEAIAVLKLCSHDWDALTVHALHDGDAIEPWETVMTIEGDYTLFAHLETVYLGVLARRTLDRDERRRACSRRRTASRSSSCPPATTTTACRPGDGYAAHVAGRDRRRADRRHLGRAGVVVGRPRHRHRAARADRGVRRQHGARRDEVRRVGAGRLNITVLVDFENDSVRDRARGRAGARRAALGRAARHLGQLVDRSLWGEMGDFDPRGVNERLVRKVRDALDADGFERVQDRRLGRLHRREDRALRASRRARRRLRRRLVADPRRERLHRRHRHGRRPAVGEGRPPLPAEPAARARRL